MTNPIRPEFELIRDFMPVLITSKFDEDPIKNERASMETPFSHYKSMGNYLDAQGHLTQREWSDLAEIRTPRFYAFPRYVQVRRRSDQNQRHKHVYVFPIISQ